MKTDGVLARLVILRPLPFLANDLKVDSDEKELNDEGSVVKGDDKN
jgi:hypothetical protein